MTRLVFLSTAHIHTRGYLKQIADSSGDLCVHAVWDDVEERGRRYAREFGARFVPDLGDVLRDPESDAFVICAENVRHAALLRQALRTRKPVFCEKPLTTTVRDARAIARLQRRLGTPLICG